uniref:Uncharacterized protein n=1 Tax=Monodelphis domestica TaxID=13616 RepID=A0A5F8GKQ3_MONDO
MDPSLLKERELFKKRALSNPSIEKRPTLSESTSSSKKKKAKLEQGGSSGSKQNSDCRLLYLFWGFLDKDTGMFAISFSS